jgi:hypothetical protein
MIEILGRGAEPVERNDVRVGVFFFVEGVSVDDSGVLCHSALI